MTASANRDRTIKTVEYFQGDRVLVTSTSAPHQFTYGGLGSGTYTFTVRCTDSAGVAVTTPAVVITVSDGTSSPVRITGQVVDSRGFAITNIRVRLDSSQGTTPTFTNTNLNGSFQFGNLPGGVNYTVTPESTIYTFSPPDMYFQSLSQNFDNATFIAQNVSYSISGRLTDAAGNAIHPATVNLSGAKTASAGTDYNGNYFFSNLEKGGTYTLQPYKNQYNFTPPTRTFTDLSAHQTADFTGTIATYTVSGRITANGAPLPNVNVTLGNSASATTTTNANGDYTFSGLATGNYTVTPSKTGYTFTPGTLTYAGLSGNQTANFSATPTEQTSRTNVALASMGATVVASSTYSAAYPVSAINNGDRRGVNWEAGGGWNDATAGQHPDWVEVRFPATRTLSEVDVFTVQDEFLNPSEPTSEMTFSKYGVTDFEVRYWDGANWLTIPGASVTANGKVWTKLTFSPVTTERLRVVLTGALAGFSRLTEVEAWQSGTAPTPTPTPSPDPSQRINVALASQGATVSASSSYSAAYPASAVTDGDRRGRNWEAGGGWNDATPNQHPDWLIVGFAGTKTIDEIYVFTIQDEFLNPAEPTAEMTFSKYGVTDFEVQYWDGAAWREIPGARVSADRRVWRKFTFPAVTTAGIRVLIGQSLEGYSRLVEVEAWQTGTAAGTTARPNHALAANGATVSASSSYSAGYPVTAINNGDRRGVNWEAGGGWNDATLGQHPDWVEVRFSGTRTLTEVDIFTVQDEFLNPSEPTSEMTFSKYGVTELEVRYWDGANWIAIPGASVTGNGKVWSKLTFAPIVTERIRVVVTGALGGYSRLTEVEAYE